MNVQLVNEVLAEIDLKLTTRERLALEIMLGERHADFEECYYRIDKGIRQINVFRMALREKQLKRNAQDAKLRDIAKQADDIGLISGPNASSSSTTKADATAAQRPARTAQRSTGVLRPKPTGQ